jgi:hypothetical protein
MIVALEVNVNDKALQNLSCNSLYDRFSDFKLLLNARPSSMKIPHRLLSPFELRLRVSMVEFNLSISPSLNTSIGSRNVWLRSSDLSSLFLETRYLHSRSIELSVNLDCGRERDFIEGLSRILLRK